MTSRAFTVRKLIRQEIKEGHVRDLYEFRTKVRRLEWAEGDKIDPRLFMEYLDYEIDCYVFPHTIRPEWYDISIFRKAERIKKSQREENHYLQSLEYRNRIISMYKKGLEDIEAYLYEHASEHDGYRIRLDVADIIRDVEKAVDKAGGTIKWTTYRNVKNLRTKLSSAI